LFREESWLPPYFASAGYIPKELGDLPKLQRLWLYSNKLTGEELAYVEPPCSKTPAQQRVGGTNLLEPP